MKLIYWKHFKEIVAGTPTRLGGVSKAPFDSLNLAYHVGDSKENVQKNRELFYKAAKITPEQLILCHQTHCDAIQKVSLVEGGRGKDAYEDGIENVDALYTYDKNLALGIYHADCIPVLFYVPSKGLIGAIHAGWQGTLKEITLKSMKKIIMEEGVNPKEIFVYLGPAITKESLEIQEDVIKLAKVLPYGEQGLINRRGKTFLDPYKLNIIQLEMVGVPLDQIEITPYSTAIDESLFFSYRRDNQVTGRHITFIYRK